LLKKTIRNLHDNNQTWVVSFVNRIIKMPFIFLLLISLFNSHQLFKRSNGNYILDKHYSGSLKVRDFRHVLVSKLSRSQKPYSTLATIIWSTPFWNQTRASNRPFSGLYHCKVLCKVPGHLFPSIKHHISPSRPGLTKMIFFPNLFVCWGQSHSMYLIYKCKWWFLCQTDLEPH
jgi:hypothetical protein